MSLLRYLTPVLLGCSDGQAQVCVPSRKGVGTRASSSTELCLCVLGAGVRDFILMMPFGLSGVPLPPRT